LAAEAARANQVAEAAALATRAAEQEIAREVRRRTEQEAAAAQAATARHEAEADAKHARNERLAADESLAAMRAAPSHQLRHEGAPTDRDSESRTPQGSVPRPASRLYPALLAAVLGVCGGAWLGTSGAIERAADGLGRDKAAINSLRLDASTERMAERISRAAALEATRKSR
jgi:hypothetical protein